MYHMRAKLTLSFCFSMLTMALKSCPPGTNLSLVAFFRSSTSGRDVLWPVRDHFGSSTISFSPQELIFDNCTSRA